MGALFTQPYRGRRSLSPMGALWRYGALSPIGGAAALWAVQPYSVHSSLSPIGGAIHSAL